jgi:protein-disulfide isomerase
VRATPTFFFGKEPVVGAVPLEKLRHAARVAVAAN